MERPAERWLPALGWEGLYEISELGNVRSVDRHVKTRSGIVRHLKGRQLRPSLDGSGYWGVALSSHGKVSRGKLHILVARAFLGAPEPGQEVCHNNGLRTDNRLENLRWDTRSANAQDTIRHGKVPYQTLKTHCPRDHEYTPENTYVDKLGKRSCRECRRAWDRAHPKSRRRGRG